jgi:DNA-binding XRE family transcriptional regulator
MTKLRGKGVAQRQGAVRAELGDQPLRQRLACVIRFRGALQLRFDGGRASAATDAAAPARTIELPAVLVVITVEQIRATRGLLGWSQSELARRAKLSLPTIKRVEAEAGPRVSDEARARIARTLESGGVQFIDENGGGAG